MNTRLGTGLEGLTVIVPCLRIVIVYCFCCASRMTCWTKIKWPVGGRGDGPCCTITTCTNGSGTGRCGGLCQEEHTQFVYEVVILALRQVQTNNIGYSEPGEKIGHMLSRTVSSKYVWSTISVAAIVYTRL